MDACKQKRLAVILALCMFIFGLGVMSFYSKGATHYWIDESPGPTYVMYERTPLEQVGCLILWTIVNGLFTVIMYFMVSP